MNRQHLKAAAEAFAGIDAIRADCYHYLNDGFDPTIQARIAKRYALLDHNDQPNKYSQRLSEVALIELQYPLPSNDESSYALTGNQRADLAGISRSTWHRNKFCDHVNFIINDIRSNSYSVWCELRKQLNE